MTDKLAVVTVTYSPGEHLKHFLTSLDTATTENPLIILADNGSTDGAPEAAAADFPRTQLVRTGGNLGYGGGINRGVREIDPDVEFLLIANPDVTFTPGSVDELLAAAQRWPRAGTLGPLIRDPDGTVYPSARRVPQLALGVGHAVLGTVWKSNPWTRSYLGTNSESRGYEANAERESGWLSGACLLVRRAAFDSVSGFDERYFMYMEDVDFCDRLGRGGWTNVYVPTAETMHDRHHAAGKVPELMLPEHHKSVYRFEADRHPLWWQAPLRGAMKIGLTVRARLAVRAALQERKRNDSR